MNSPEPEPGPGPIVGVLLAAGRGRRLGGDKQLRHWSEGRPLVSAAFDAIAPVCTQVIVVLGHRAEEVAAALRPRAFSAAHADPDVEMFESVRAGLSAAQRLGANAHVLLHPADHPQVAPGTLRSMLAARRSAGARAIIPEHEGRGGHPVLIPPALIAPILAFSGTGGLRRFWHDHPALCLRLAVDDPAALRDVDEPGDLAAGVVSDDARSHELRPPPGR